MALKYRIEVTESERGWGQDRWTEDFDSFAEAKARIESINAENTAEVAPDWYMVAKREITVVEV
jgi:hypothetical protein